MKKTNKIIAVLAVLVAGSMIASAALVGYLSNPVTTEVTVSSPMEQWNSYSGNDGEWTIEDLSFPDVLGGEPVTFYVRTKNNAEVSITGNGENIVTNPSGVTPEDFESVIVSTDGGPEYDLIDLGLCTQGDDENTVVFSYGPIPTIWTAGQVDKNKIVVTFKTDASGTYTFTSQIVPATT